MNVCRPEPGLCLPASCREPSFGHAILTIYNATTARFEWHRNQVSPLAPHDCRQQPAARHPGSCLSGRVGTSSLTLKGAPRIDMQDGIPVVTDAVEITVDTTACP